jgi:hypothetical protein
MQTVYIGNTLVNDVMLGSQRMDDVFTGEVLNIDWLIVAGGGGGGNGISSFDRGGYGGAGRFVNSSATIRKGTSINLTVGAGGSRVLAGTLAAGGDGNSSTINILGTTYIAGGGGGGGQYGGNGRPGGSGGGGGEDGGLGGSAQNGTPLAGFGNNGSPGTSALGGNGGGAGGINNTSLAWLDGLLYAGGDGTPGGGGDGGLGSSGDSGAGESGIIKIRYEGTTKGTGGTITQNGGYTYHTFTGNGTFTF